MATENKNQASPLQSGRFIALIVAAFSALVMLWPLAMSQSVWEWNQLVTFLVGSMAAGCAAAVVLFRYHAAPSPSRFYLSHALGIYFCVSVALGLLTLVAGDLAKAGSTALQTWSLYLSRSLLLAILLLGALASHPELDRQEGWRGTPGAMWFWSFSLAILLALLSFLLPLPRTLFVGPMGGVQEFLMLLLAISGFTVVLRTGVWIRDDFAYGFSLMFLLEAIASTYLLLSPAPGSPLHIVGALMHMGALVVPVLTVHIAMFHLYWASEQYRAEKVETAAQWAKHVGKGELPVELFRQAVEQAHDPLYIADRDGHVIFVNAGFTSMTGYKSADILGETPDRWHAQPEEGACTQILSHVRIRKEPAAVTLQRRRKDGGKFEASVHISPILNELNEVAWFVVREQDLSEGKERTLLLQQILDNMPLGICLVEVPSTKVLLANHYAVTLFRRLHLKQVEHFREVYEFFRSSDGKLYPEEQLPITLTQKSRETSELDDIEVWPTAGKAVEMIWKMHAMPLFDARAQLRSVLLAFDDVTQEKTLAHKMTDTISVVAHQLRTPLTGIKWALDEYRKSEKQATSEEDREALFDTLYEATVRMFDVVQGLLDATKIEQGKIELKPEPVRLDQYLNTVFREFAPVIGARKIQVKQSVLHTIPEASYDLILIHQVVQNILDNAVKYTPEGGEIDSILSLKKNRIHWALHDTGIGISREDLVRIFEKFHRGDNAQKRDAYGMGLGLYTVKSIVDLLGGEISIESEEGHGTTVHVYFPLSDSNM